MAQGRSLLAGSLLIVLLTAAPAVTVAFVGGAHLEAPLSPDQLSARLNDATVTIRSANGPPTAVAVDQSTRLSALAELQQGWLLATTTLDENGNQRARLILRRSAREFDLPALPTSGEKIQERPTPLVVDGQLTGVSWLDGSSFRSLTVRVADWDGMRWSDARIVSLPSHGSQMALSATVLDDGSPLLVWSQFDGRDDEIVWSQRRGGQWTAPARIEPDNQVPDITPTLLATRDGGALVAWLQFVDGDYRLLTSHFDGGSWTKPQRLPGLGAGDPMLLDRDGPVVSYHSVRPSAWWVARLDASTGRATAYARQARVLREEPSVAFTANTLTFTWSDLGVRSSVRWEPAR